MSQGSFYITTPIYYVNAAPHLGTAYTTIGADALARFKRLSGFDVAFVGGMDEHGQKVAETAAGKGMSPQEWCDSMEPAFLQAWELLDITYTDIVRTSSARQTRTVQDFLNCVYDAGWLYKASYEGWYCVHEETYYAESDLERNEEGQFVCPDCKRPVRYEAGGEENWFFKLSAFQDRLLELYEQHPDFIQPETRRNEIVSFVKGGLKDLSISRSTFDWGIPLPFDEDHVAYVWFDALLAYFTGIGYADPERAGQWERYWPAAYHFVGKDITRFHCVIWPAMLMAAGMPLPEHVFGHGFLLTKGEKMSKSKGNGVMPADLVKVFGVDAYRYYFLSDVQFGHDGDISLERMVQVYNADLANTWGNLCSRVFNMTGKYFEGRVPAAPAGAERNPLADVAAGLYDEYSSCMDAVDFTGAAFAVRKLAEAANLYVENMAPWNLAKDLAHADDLACVMYNLLEACRICALFYAPFMPRSSQEVFARLGLGSIEDAGGLEEASAWGGLPAGNTVVTGDPLFPRLDADSIDLSLQ